jgi:hypothetical protein
VKGDLTPEDLRFIDAFAAADSKKQMGEFVRDVLTADQEEWQEEQRSFLELITRAKAAKEGSD